MFKAHSQTICDLLVGGSGIATESLQAALAAHAASNLALADVVIDLGLIAPDGTQLG